MPFAAPEFIPESLLPTALASVDGVISSLKDARVPMCDRGFLFAEAAYEVALVRNRKIFAEELHMRRLERSLAGIGLLSDGLLASVRKTLTALLRAAKADELAMLYWQVSGGSGPRELVPRSDFFPHRICAFWQPFDAGRLDRLRAEGTSLATVKDLRWPLATFKTTQLLGNALAQREALLRGARDALLIDAEGHLLEGANSNLFLVIDGIAWTPPATSNLLPGVTRELLLGLFPEGCREIALNSAVLPRATEAFITSTTRPVVGVRSIDGIPLPEFQGPVTSACAKAIDALMAEEFARASTRP